MNTIYVCISSSMRTELPEMLPHEKITLYHPYLSPPILHPYPPKNQGIYWKHLPNPSFSRQMHPMVLSHNAREQKRNTWYFQNTSKCRERACVWGWGTGASARGAITGGTAPTVYDVRPLGEWLQQYVREGKKQITTVFGQITNEANDKNKGPCPLTDFPFVQLKVLCSPLLATFEGTFQCDKC